MQKNFEIINCKRERVKCTPIALIIQFTALYNPLKESLNCFD